MVKKIKGNLCGVELNKIRKFGVGGGKWHNWLTPKAEVRESSIGGKGVFAKKFIKAGELISIWGGCVITKKEMEKIEKMEEGDIYPTQILKGFWFGAPTRNDADGGDYFNHSCEPNAGIKGSNILFARRDIFSGEEITFDYSTTESEDVEMKCSCGIKTCRKLVSGDDWKNPEFREKNKGWFIWYIQEMIDAEEKIKLSSKA